MKTVLYMAISVNGMIAKGNDNTGFVSDVEWESFRAMIQKIGNMVIGIRTYEIMKDGGEFQELGGIKVVVVTNDKALRTINENYLIASSPKEALDILGQQGFQEALIAGGGMLNASFMRENLVDEIYLDVEPIVFGRGTKLFAEGDFEAQLELVETRKLSENEIQLHYRVKK